MSDEPEGFHEHGVSEVEMYRICVKMCRLG